MSPPTPTLSPLVPSNVGKAQPGVLAEARAVTTPALTSQSFNYHRRLSVESICHPAHHEGSAPSRLQPVAFNQIESATPIPTTTTYTSRKWLKEAVSWFGIDNPNGRDVRTFDEGCSAPPAALSNSQKQRGPAAHTIFIPDLFYVNIHPVAPLSPSFPRTRAEVPGSRLSDAEAGAPRKRRRRADEIPRDIARRCYKCDVLSCTKGFARPSALKVRPPACPLASPPERS